jgi:hypothetical protein
MVGRSIPPCLSLGHWLRSYAILFPCLANSVSTTRLVSLEAGHDSRYFRPGDSLASEVV